MPQPNFGPFTSSTSRSTQRSGISGSTSASRGRPFTVSLIIAVSSFRLANVNEARRKSIVRVLLFLIAASLVPLSALGQERWPAKPVRVVVGYSAGGGNDIVMRLLAPELAKGLGQPVVVDNRPGAQSIIAAELVARSSPDGYTLLMGPSGPMTINPATYSKLPYDPIRDFAPVSLIAQFPLIVTVNAKLPIRSVQELVGYARANPGAANYASSAGVFQLATELFKQKTGTSFTLIPYKGSNESVQAVVSGLVTMTIVDPPPASPALRNGTLRALAVTSAHRHPSWPA